MSDRPVRRMGRPPLDTRHPSVAVSTRLSAPDYDALCRRAQRERVSVADMLRQRLHAADRHDDDT